MRVHRSILKCDLLSVLAIGKKNTTTKIHRTTKWCRFYKQGHEKLSDLPRFNRPSMIEDELNVRVHEKLRSDRSQ